MSTVLASRNNHHNHQASYMGEIPNYMNPNPNPNRNPKPKSKKIKHFSNTHNHQVIKKDSAGDAYSFNQRPVENEGFNCGGYVSYKVGSCSRSEINELRKKLVSDLERIRKLNDRIQSGEFSNPKLMNNTRSVNGKFKKVGAGNKRPLSSFREMSNGDNGIGVMDEEMLKKCKQVLTKLMKHKMSWVFKAPVDVVGLGLHDYHQIIKRPMDLGTVKSNLSKGFYSNVGDFAADVRLVFENAMLYNPRTDDVHGMADQMLRIFEDLFRPIQAKLGKNDGRANGNERVGNVNVGSNARVFDMANERVVNVNDMVNDVVNEVNRANEFSAVDELDGSSWDDIQTPERTKKAKGEGKSSGFPVASKQIHSTASNAVNAVIPPVVHSPVRMLSRTPSPMQVTEPVKPSNTSTMTRTVLPKLPKPRAKDPNKREMNMEEKQKLGLGLQSMPPEKMPQLLQIIRKRNDQLAQEGDEIELDIEALDTETLWELDRFVTNWKKFVSKTKRQALMVNSASAVAAPSVSADIDDVPMSEKMDGVKKNKKEAGEEDVDIGDEMPESSFPHVEIEKDDGGGGHGQAATGGGQGNNGNNASSSSSGSSSSSSSGSSSSSDSDSGSSSGSDSDADDAQS